MKFMPWDSDQHDKFIEARSNSVCELHAMMPDQNFKSIVDLNCGTGKQALQLAQHFPKAHVLGIDRHLSASCQSQTNQNLSFKKADFLDFQNRDDLRSEGCVVFILQPILII